MAKIGVVLSGCGVFDGAEIHEATLTLFFLDRAGAEIVCMAPSVEQFDVVNHLGGESYSEKRNVLVEAARIARGDIRDVKDVDAAMLDGLIFPGGFGAAKNLCNFAVKGPDCTVNPEIERLIKAAHKAKKPMGFLCIAPVIAAKVLGSFRPQITIGNDKDTAAALEKMGARHVVSEVDGIVVDPDNLIVTTPAYMLGPSIAKVGLGIEKLVDEVMKLVGK
jgi:enhancing lycopene biosynthesis protein 2